MHAQSPTKGEEEPFWLLLSLLPSRTRIAAYLISYLKDTTAFFNAGCSEILSVTSPRAKSRATPFYICLNVARSTTYLTSTLSFPVASARFLCSEIRWAVI